MQTTKRDARNMFKQLKFSIDSKDLALLISSGLLADGKIVVGDSSGTPYLKTVTIAVDSSGHMTPDADNAQDIGSSSKNLREIFVRVIESQAGLIIQAATSISNQATAGDITETVAAAYKYNVVVDSAEIFNAYKSGGQTFLGWLDSVIQLSGVASAPGTPSAGYIYAWKLDATANKIYYKGEDGIAHLWTLHMLANQNQSVLRSQLPHGSVQLLLTSGTAYFVYLGLTSRAFTPKKVKFRVTTAGLGAQTAEVGFFSTPSAPNAAGQTLTKLVADATVDDLTTTGTKANTSAMATSVAEGVHLWAGFRVAMATTQPTVEAIGLDYGEGAILSTAGATAFGSGTTYTGALITDGADVCPGLLGSIN